MKSNLLKEEKLIIKTIQLRKFNLDLYYKMEVIQLRANKAVLPYNNDQLDMYDQL